MSLVGRTFRAYRPSSYSQSDDLQEQPDMDRQAKITLYLKRAEAGLPLFEADEQYSSKRRTTVA